jgi:hypothetical protein
MRHPFIPASLRAILILLFLTVLTACAALPPRVTPTPPATSIIPLFNTSTPVPSFTLAPTVTSTPVVALARPSYTLNTLMDFDRHTVSADEVIIYPNHTGQVLTRLVLAVVPNLWPDCFAIDSFAIDGQPSTAFVVDGQRMDVTLPSPLGPEEMIRLNIKFTLALPFAEQADPSVSRPRIFGYTRAQTNLTNWYPFIVPYINGDWVLHEPWYYGEHLVYDAADYDVSLSFADPATAPAVASSGAVAVSAGGATSYSLTAGRSFAFSMSREFKVATQQVGDITVTSYYFPFYESGGQGALNAATQAVQIYSQRFGPYSHKSLAVVMADFNDGMEYSGFFYLSRDFYNLYTTAAGAVNYLVFVAAHETAHQWWFEQVGNDQAEQPWLDEALCTYSERLFYESAYPDLVPGWWAYRVDFYQPQGFVDIPIYEGQGFRPYTNAVYFRGAHFLEDLRARLGDEIFFAFLQDYLAQERGKIATAADFFTVLDQHTKADYSDIVRQYFQNIY